MTRFISRFSEFMVPAFIGIFIIIYMVSTRKLPPKSVLFPYGVFIALVTLSLYMIATHIMGFGWNGSEKRGGKTTGSETHQGRLQVHHPLVLLIGAVIYVILWGYAGFLVSTGFFLMGTMLALSVEPLRALYMTVGVTFTMYVLFGVFLGMEL